MYMRVYIYMYLHTYTHPFETINQRKSYIIWSANQFESRLVENAPVSPICFYGKCSDKPVERVVFSYT